MRSFILLGVGQALFVSSLLTQVFSRGLAMTDVGYVAIFISAHLIDKPWLMAVLIVTLSLIPPVAPLYALSILLASGISVFCFRLYKEEKKTQELLNSFYEKALRTALENLALSEQRLETFICEPPSYRYEPEPLAPASYTGYDETLDVLEKKMGLQFKPEKIPLKRLRRLDSRQTTLFDFES